MLSSYSPFQPKNISGSFRLLSFSHSHFRNLFDPAAGGQVEIWNSQKNARR
jgi:hypothetical protein